VTAGCGAAAQPRPAPRIGAREAAKLEALAGRVAANATRDPCAAHAAAASLQTEADAAVNGGRIPVALRGKLLAGVAAVVQTAPACNATPTPTPAPAPVVVHPAPRPHPEPHPKPHDHHPKPPKPHGHGPHGHDH
jgi:outer membrane biosynthesis protein TonB